MNLQIHNLYKSYGPLKILNNINFSLSEGRTYCLMGTSGSGKTTLLRILLGLENADSGLITGISGARLAAVFQEDRLCEAFSPLENVMMAAEKKHSPDQIKTELCRLLPEESITRPVRTLSGGMKRRTAICRALLAPSDGIVMDEPFTGLDEQTKLSVINYILEKSNGKLLLIATHQEEDIALLDAALITLPPNLQIPTKE